MAPGGHQAGHEPASYCCGKQDVCYSGVHCTKHRQVKAGDPLPSLVPCPDLMSPHLECLVPFWTPQPKRHVDILDTPALPEKGHEDVYVTEV